MDKETIIYGYCITTSKQQSISCQSRKILKEYPDAVIVEEYNVKALRPKFDSLKRWVFALKNTKNVHLVFNSITNISENPDDAFSLYKDFYLSGIELSFIDEHFIDTAIYERYFNIHAISTENNTSIDAFLSSIKEHYIDLMLSLLKEQIAIVFNNVEKEKKELKEKTSYGMMVAKQNGKQIGRICGEKYPTQKQKKAVDIIYTKNVDFGGDLTDCECRELIGCSRNSFYKYKKIAKSI